MGEPWMPSLFSRWRTRDLLRTLRNEQAQAAPVVDVRLASGERQQDLAATVRDEPFDAVQIPVAVLVLVGSKTNGLQVASGIRFGQHHSTRYFAFGETGQNFVLDLIIRKGIDRFGDALQTEQIHEGAVGTTDDFGCHRVKQIWAIDAAILAWQGESHHVRLGQAIEIPLYEGMERDRTVLVERIALTIDLSRR